MAHTSARLFSAWAAKHKEFVALQERLERAQREGSPEAALLEEQVRALKAEADRMQDEALAAFRTEMRDRGLG